MSGSTFFELAWRVSAYEGVMTMRLRAQQERGSQPAAQAPRYSAPTTAPTPAAAPETHETKEVGLDQFCLLFPGMVSRSVVTSG